MQENAVIVDTSKACAVDYGVFDTLSSVGIIDVKYMGKPLTQSLKGNYHVITF